MILRLTAGKDAVAIYAGDVSAVMVGSAGTDVYTGVFPTGITVNEKWEEVVEAWETGLATIMVLQAGEYDDGDEDEEEESED